MGDSVAPFLFCSLHNIKRSERKREGRKSMGDTTTGEMKVPQHVAIILDGNGRWAKSKGMPRNYGHVQGAKTVEVICEEAYRMGIQYLTVYAFSTENWGAR